MARLDETTELRGIDGRNVFSMVAGMLVLAVVGAPGCTPTSGNLGGSGEQPPAADAAPAGGNCGSNVCAADQYCSVTDACIPVGTCATDNDCDDGKRCGAGSAQCLAEDECAASGDCDEGMVCNTNERQCLIGGQCGASEISATRETPNVLILLDRSGSMAAIAGGQSRWNAAKRAIEVVTTANDADLRFGLATYSSCMAGGCSAGSVVVPIANDNASEVNGFLADKLDQGSGGGSTSTAAGIQYLCDSGLPETTTGPSLFALMGEPSLQDTQRDNAVLLITDGEESSSCVQGFMDGSASAAALIGQTVPVRTYVVGLGINSSVLNQISIAGGTVQLLPADDEAQLTAALAAVATDLMSCEVLLHATPPNSDEIYVFFNDELPAIPRDPANGWSYDEATLKVTFSGAACVQLKSGTVTDVDVVYGCPEPVVE